MPVFLETRVSIFYRMTCLGQVKVAQIPEMSSSYSEINHTQVATWWKFLCPCSQFSFLACLFHLGAMVQRLPVCLSQYAPWTVSNHLRSYLSLRMQTRQISIRSVGIGQTLWKGLDQSNLLQMSSILATSQFQTWACTELTPLMPSFHQVFLQLFCTPKYLDLPLKDCLKNCKNWFMLHFD